MKTLSYEQAGRLARAVGYTTDMGEGHLTDSHDEWIHPNEIIEATMKNVWRDNERHMAMFMIQCILFIIQKRGNVTLTGPLDKFPQKIFEKAMLLVGERPEVKLANVVELKDSPDA